MTRPVIAAVTAPSRLVLRETLISMTINAAISAGFFFVMFGLSEPIPSRAFGFDFLPQAFMVALMGALVPGLLVRRHGDASVGEVAMRAVAIALAAVILAGGGALALFATRDFNVLPAAALATKVVFGALLAAVVTPVAVRAALRRREGR